MVSVGLLSKARNVVAVHVKTLCKAHIMILVPHFHDNRTVPTDVGCGRGSIPFRFSKGLSLRRMKEDAQRAPINIIVEDDWKL